MKKIIPSIYCFSNSVDTFLAPPPPVLNGSRQALVSFWGHVFPEFPQTQFFTWVIEEGHDVGTFSGFNFYHNHSPVEELKFIFPLTFPHIINNKIWYCFLCTLSSCTYYYYNIINTLPSSHCFCTSLPFAWLCLHYHSDLSSSINTSRGLSRPPYLILLAFPNTIPVAIHHYVTHFMSLI